MSKDTRSGMPKAEAEAIYKELGFEEIAVFPIKGLKLAWDKTRDSKHEVVHYARRDGLLLSVDYWEDKINAQKLVCNWQSNAPMQSMDLLNGFSHDAWYPNQVFSSVLQYGNSLGLRRVIESLENEGVFKLLPSEEVYVKLFGVHEVDYSFQEQQGVDDYHERVKKVDEVRQQRRNTHPAWVSEMII